MDESERNVSWQWNFIKIALFKPQYFMMFRFCINKQINLPNSIALCRIKTRAVNRKASTFDKIKLDHTPVILIETREKRKKQSAHNHV